MLEAAMTNDGIIINVQVFCFLHCFTNKYCNYENNLLFQGVLLKYFKQWYLLKIIENSIL